MQDLPIRHEFEDADSGDEIQLELDMTYTVHTTFVELGGGPVAPELVFTHRVRLHTMTTD
jgi:hypothetical protein